MASEGFFLAALPTELLAQILSARLSDAAIRLWKCGNRILNQRLTEGGVAEIRLKDTRANSSSRWPVLLSSFSRLRTLIIWRPSKTLDSLSNIRNGLQSLPPTLEHLELHFVNAFESLYCEDKLLEVINKNRSFEYGAQFDRICDYDTAAMWDMNAKFPILKTLIVGGQEEHRLQFASDVDFGALPRSLTRLVLKTGDRYFPVVVPTWNRYELLPRGLTQLAVKPMEAEEPKAGGLLPNGFYRFALLNRQHIALLPPGLTDVDGLLFDRSVLSAADIAAFLPRSLTRITSMYGHNPPLLPNGRYLAIMNDDLFDQPLPQSLTHVSLAVANGLITADQVLALPRTLKHLRSGARFDWARFKPSTLPDQLLSFEIHHDLPLSAFSLMPRSLTDLQGQISTNIDLQAISTLPPHLTRLHLTVVLDGILLEADAVSLLPRDLRTLSIPACPTSSSPKLFVETLPPYLTTLSLYGPPTQSHWNPEHFVGLSKTLTDLSLLNAPATVDYWQNLPFSLKRLSHRHYGIGSIIVDAIGKTRLLPPNLKHLGVCNMVISGDDLQHLPRTLKRLYNSDIGTTGRLYIQDAKVEHFSQLPPHIQIFEVEFVDFCAPSSIDRQQLPRSLESRSGIIFPLVPNESYRHARDTHEDEGEPHPSPFDKSSKRCIIM